MGRIKYGMQSAQLKEIRAFDPERHGRWSFSSQQATLRRLDKAFAAFFRRIKAGGTPGYPRFRGVNWFDTVDFPKDGDGCRWDSTPHDPVTRVRFQGVGHVKVNQHRAVVGKVKTVSVKREGRKWFVVLTAEQGVGCERACPGKDQWSGHRLLVLVRQRDFIGDQFVWCHHVGGSGHDPDRIPRRQHTAEEGPPARGTAV